MLRRLLKQIQVYLLMVGPIKDPQEEILVHLLRKDLIALIYMDSGLSHHLELERIDFGMDISWRNNILNYTFEEVGYWFAADDLTYPEEEHISLDSVPLFDPSIMNLCALASEITGRPQVC